MLVVSEMSEGGVARVAEIEESSPSPWTEGQIAVELVRQDGLTLIIKDGEHSEVLGWCCVRIVGSEAELFKIAVSDTCRKTGIGSFLFKELCLNLLSQGVEAMLLEVRSQNRSAICFYLKHGFDKVGMRPNYYSTPRDNALIFRKELILSEF